MYLSPEIYIYTHKCSSNYKHWTHGVRPNSYEHCQMGTVWRNVQQCHVHKRSVCESLSHRHFTGKRFIGEGIMCEVINFPRHVWCASVRVYRAIVIMTMIRPPYQEWTKKAHCPRMKWFRIVREFSLCALLVDSGTQQQPSFPTTLPQDIIF